MASWHVKGVVLPLAITLAVQAFTSMAMIAPSVMAPVAAVELGVSSQGIGWFVALEYLFAMRSAVILVSVLFGACAVGWNGVYLAEVARLAPPGRVGAITGGTQFFTFIGALAAQPLFGFVVGLAGNYGKAYLAFCLLPALAGLRLLLGARRV